MPLPEEVMRRYVLETAGVEVSDDSIARLTEVSAVVVRALQTSCSQSLFDTEPEQLHSVLESLADDDTA